MFKHTKRQAFGWTALAASAVLVLSGIGFVPNPDDEWDEVASRFDGAPADTKPIHDAIMAFSAPVEIREILANGGERVTEGQILVRARDTQVQALLKQQEIRAAVTHEIDSAKANIRLAQFNYDNLHGGDEASTSTPKEKIEADVALANANFAAAQAETNHQLEVYRLDQARGEAERYRLEAPFDGIIEEVKADRGQGVRDGEPVLRIVNIDRLKLDAFAPTDETMVRNLKAGDSAWVLLDLPRQPLVVLGRIAYLSPVADSVSQTRRVRVEIENSGGWPAGTQAVVRFERPSGEWVFAPQAASSVGANP